MQVVLELIYVLKLELLIGTTTEYATLVLPVHHLVNVVL